MFHKILVPLDGSDLAEDSIGRAAALARASGASIELVMVHQPFFFDGMRDPTWNETQIVAEHAYLETIRVELAAGAGIRADVAVLHGLPAEGISLRAQDSRADLIVMTSHGRTGLSRAWLGSVADGVARHAATPVLLLRPVASKKDRRALQKPFQRILVPVDGSALALEVLDSAISLAQANHATIHLLRIVAPVPVLFPGMGMPSPVLPANTDSEATEALVASARGNLEEVARLVTDRGATVDGKVVLVDPFAAQAISDYASGHAIDAVAMCSHGRGASRLVIGAVADKVRRALDLPILLYHPARVRIEELRLTERTVEQELPLVGARG